MDLSKWNDHYKASSTPVPLDQVPDGRYDAIIQSARISTGGERGPSLILIAEIRSGDMTGCTVSRLHQLPSDNVPLKANLTRIEFIKREMTVLGVELDPFDTLPQRLTSFSGRPCVVAISTRDGFKTIYLQSPRQSKA